MKTSQLWKGDFMECKDCYEKLTGIGFYQEIITKKDGQTVRIEYLCWNHSK